MKNIRRFSVVLAASMMLTTFTPTAAFFTQSVAADTQETVTEDTIAETTTEPVTDTTVDTTTEPAQTVLKGLVCKNGKYYYYKDGKRVKNCWKTIKSGTKSYRYYFGKTGAAYAAEKDEDHPHAITVKKINGVRYGFLSNGHCVKGTYCDSNCTIYYFNKDYKYNSKRTANLRKLGKQGAKATALLNKLGKAQKLVKTTSCYDEGTDYEYYYKTFKAIIFKSARTGKKIVLGYTPL